MKYSRFFLSMVAVLAAANCLWAGSITGGSLIPCTTAPLSTYIDGSNSGCALGVLVFSGWGLGTLNGPGKAVVPLSSGQILVTPVKSANGLGGSFAFSAVSGSSFLVGAGQVESYFINNSYFIDPGPVESSGSLDLDPGNVTITQFFCNDSVLVNVGPTPVCRIPSSFTSASTASSASPSPQTLQVTTTNPHASIVFNPPAFQFGSIETEIMLDGTNGAANFDNIVSTLGVVPFAQTVPEPAGFALALGGLAALGMCRKYAMRRG